MLIRASFETNEVDIAGTAADWAIFCHSLESDSGDYLVGISPDASPWDCYLTMLSPVENGGASRWKMAARGIEGLNGVAPGEPGIGIG